MANNALLLQLAQGVQGPPQDHQRNALYAQQRQQNALGFQQQQEDRQRQMQAHQQEQINSEILDAVAPMLMPGVTEEQAGAYWRQTAPAFKQKYPQLQVPDQYPGRQALIGMVPLPPQLRDKLIGGALEQPKAEAYTLTPGSTRFGPDGKQIANVPAAPQRPLASDNAVVAVADPTSPTGFKYVRRTDAAGKPAPAPRATNPSRYSQKELEGARGKVRIIDAAKRQLEAVKAARDKLKGAVSSGPFGAGYIPTEEGSNFDGAVDTLRSTIEGLTRTPGIGAQSDFEARLNQAKLPSRNEYESTRDNKIKALEDLIYGLESGYSDLLSEGQQPNADPNAADPQDLLDAADAILNAP